MKAFNTIAELSSKDRRSYISPNVNAAPLYYDIVLCFSGDHEDFVEEEW